MKQERLYILVYLKNSKILIKNLKHLDNFIPSNEDLFIFVRDEYFFGDKGILEISEYFEISNLEDIMNENLKKIFFTPYLIKLNYEKFLRETNDSDLYHDIKDLYEFYINKSKEFSLEEFKSSFDNEKFKESLNSKN